MLIKMIPKTIFNIPNRCLPLICGLFSLIVPFECVQQRNTQDEFSCPEEFGYYPHPTDCTQYYICVFGGALLESCTGGLMYSHDLQTCDWPRNVGCGGSVAASTKNFDKVGAASANLNIDNELTTLSWKHDILESNRERHLYDEENLPLVSELENDRQQRVYRGQPSTLSQVARDRDGGVIRHANALQTLARLEKMKPLAVVSFGSHHQSLRGAKNDSKMSNETSRGIGGYALRYRPHKANFEDNYVGNVNTYDLDIGRTNKSHKYSTADSPVVPATNFIFNLSTSSPINLFSSYPVRPSSPPAYSVSHNNELLLVTTQRTNIHHNPLLSESMRYDRFSDLDDKSLVVTDFSIVNVVPKMQRSPFVVTKHPAINTGTFIHPFQLYNQAPVPLMGNVASGNYPQPYYFNGGNVMSNNYHKTIPSPLVYPPFILPNGFHDPKISIVTLSYPKLENTSVAEANPTNGVSEYTTDASRNVSANNDNKNVKNESGDVQNGKHNVSLSVEPPAGDNVESNDKNRVIISRNKLENDDEYNNNEEFGDDEMENDEMGSEEIEQITSSEEQDRRETPAISENVPDFEVSPVLVNDDDKPQNQRIKNEKAGNGSGKKHVKMAFKKTGENEENQKTSKETKDAVGMEGNIQQRKKEKDGKNGDEEEKSGENTKTREKIEKGKTEADDEKFEKMNDNNDYKKKNKKWGTEGYDTIAGVELVEQINDVADVDVEDVGEEDDDDDYDSLRAGVGDEEDGDGMVIDENNEDDNDEDNQEDGGNEENFSLRVVKDKSDDYKGNKTWKNKNMDKYIMLPSSSFRREYVINPFNEPSFHSNSDYSSFIPYTDVTKNVTAKKENKAKKKTKKTRGISYNEEAENNLSDDLSPLAVLRNTKRSKVNVIPTNNTLLYKYFRPITSERNALHHLIKQNGGITPRNGNQTNKENLLDGSYTSRDLSYEGQEEYYNKIRNSSYGVDHLYEPIQDSVISLILDKVNYPNNTLAFVDQSNEKKKMEDYHRNSRKQENKWDENRKMVAR